MNYEYLKREFVLNDLLEKPLDKDIEDIYNFFLELEINHEVVNSLGHVLYRVKNQKYFGREHNNYWFIKNYSDENTIRFHICLWNIFLPKYQYLESSDKIGCIKFFIEYVFNLKCEKIVLL